MEVHEVTVDKTTEQGKKLTALLEEMTKKKTAEVKLCDLADYHELEDFVAEKQKERVVFIDEMKAVFDRHSEERKKWTAKFEAQNKEFWEEAKPILKAAGILPEDYTENDNLHIKLKEKALYYEKNAGPKHIRIEG